jgi:hypothetical protein
MKGGFQMIRKIQVVTSLVVLATGIGFAAPQMGTQYSENEVKVMIRGARSPQQYQALATYFRSRQQALEQQAQAEKAEWERRSQVSASVAQKYPRPVDSSKNRYEYFSYEANQMGQQAAHYESLSASASQPAVQ